MLPALPSVPCCFGNSDAGLPSTGCVKIKGSLRLKFAVPTSVQVELKVWHKEEEGTLRLRF